MHAQHNYTFLCLHIFSVVFTAPPPVGIRAFFESMEPFFVMAAGARHILRVAGRAGF